MQNAVGPHGRLFAERQPGTDATAFQTVNTSVQYYKSPYYLLHTEQLQPVPAPRFNPPRMDLAYIIGDEATEAIKAAQRIAFHAVGDTGVATEGGPDTQASLADMMVQDVQAGGADAPAFFFHLGDVVYNFGEGRYYYDQFYAPFRAYDRPIFAIPGNHDGIVFGDSPDTPFTPTLQAFLRHFCAESAGLPPDAGGLVRSVMTQPGVYFALDAPFVSIIGLYSNVLRDDGVISSQGGTYPIGDEQLDFLKNELARLKPLREEGDRAVILAVHHPPLSIDSEHGGTTGLSEDIDAACREAGFWPDAVLSGHAHLYQRFTHRQDGREIPYIVSGSGGHKATKPQEGVLSTIPLTIGEHTLEKEPVFDFGYLTVTTDAKTLTITFRSPNQDVVSDSVIVDLATNRIA